MDVYRRLATCMVLFVASTLLGPANADELADCRRAIRSITNVESCNRIIANTKSSPRRRAVAYRYRGDVRITAGAITAAIADFTKSLQLEPKSVPALAGRGRSYLMAGSLQNALADYSRAIQFSPKSEWLYIERGHVYLNLGNTKAAISDLDKAIQLSPNDARAHNNRGLAYRKAGDLDKAYSDYTNAIRLNPVYAIAFANRGYLDAARGRKASAIEDLQMSLMLDPANAGARAALKKLGITGSISKESLRLSQLGKTLVASKCSQCHATGPKGASPNPKAPEFRRLRDRHPMMALREPLTRGIAAPHEQMPKFQLSDKEIDAIVAYINGLPATNSKWITRRKK